MESLLIEGFHHDPFKFNLESGFPISSHQFRDSEEYDSVVFDDLVSLEDLSQGSDSNLARGYAQGKVVLESADSNHADFPDACLKYMNEILMEENLEDLPYTLEGSCALRACEKELYDVLSADSPEASSGPFLSFSSSSFKSPDACLNDSPLSHGNNKEEYVGGQNFFDPSNLVLTPSESEALQSSESNSQTSPSSNGSSGFVHSLMDSPSSIMLPMEETKMVDMKWLREAMKNIPDLGCHCQPGGEACSQCKGLDGLQVDEPRGKRSHQRDDSEDEDARSNKHMEPDDSEEEIQMEQYDDVLLCSQGVEVALACLKGSSSSSTSEIKPQQKGNSKGSRSRASRSKKQSSKTNEKKEELFDLTTLLTHCAQAVASFDLRSAKDLLTQIRQHSSPRGDSIQRLAHYFADGLQARIDGNGAKLSRNLSNRRVPVSDVLRAYRAFVAAIPFKRTSYFLANLTIVKFAETTSKKKIHIIDFGIFYGFQWPCFIQKLSQRPNGPPELRITGVDYPESGFRPAKAVEETGRRLAGYCKRFGVPFKFRGIAKKWENLKVEDFEIEEDEVVVVNSLYGQKRLLDETVEAESPRDAFFDLIRKLNPDLFIQGIVNGAFNAPFFITRFREAMFYYSSVFDLFEATMARDDQERMLIERELYGAACLNVIACEGAEREERPETYKQWQVRTMRAGFKRVPLDQEYMIKAKEKVKANYHKDFVVGEDNHWMIQGWKGRILHALSIWKPV